MEPARAAFATFLQGITFGNVKQRRFSEIWTDESNATLAPAAHR